MNVPLDDVHVACLQARADIRLWFAALRLAVHQWEPAPMPGTRRAASAVPGTPLVKVPNRDVEEPVTLPKVEPAA